MSKMDTHGMSGPVDPNYKELKILINEVLDEREHKKKLVGAYDDVKPLPPSYFDREAFSHRIDEPEPPYEDWSQ